MINSSRVKSEHSLVGKWWSKYGESVPWVRLILITPDLAREFMKHNTTNRNFRPHLMERYRRDIEQGRWRLNGETIIFDTHGVLASGQHRLTAIIAADVAIESLVVFDVAPEATSSIECGAKRSPADQLSIKGYQNATSLASSARMLLCYKDRMINRGGRYYTDLEIQECLESNYGMCALASAYIGPIRDLMPASCFICARYITDSIDRDLSELFWSDIVLGERLKAGDPAYCLRLKMISFKSSRDKPRPWISFYATAIAWNACRSGKQISRIIIPASPSECPQFI